MAVLCILLLCSYPVFPTSLEPDYFNPQSSLESSGSISKSPAPPLTSGSPTVARRTTSEKLKDKEVKLCVEGHFVWVLEFSWPAMKIVHSKN